MLAASPATLPQLLRQSLAAAAWGTLTCCLALYPALEFTVTFLSFVPVPRGTGMGAFYVAGKENARFGEGPSLCSRSVQRLAQWGPSG